MLTFFTDPYKDEILYSTIARYHYYIGNIDFKDTLREVFGKDSVIPSIELSSHLEILANNLGKKYSSEDIISKHTIFPFYAPFLPRNRKQELLNDMKYGHGKGLYTEIGMVAGSICKKEGIYYCPICSKRDIETYGEAYIHREHQLQGVFVCPHNEAKLKKYEIDKRNTSRVSFIRLDERYLDFNVEYENDKTSSRLIEVSKAAYYLLENDLFEFNKDIITKKYKELLDKKELLSINKNIKQRELYEEFMNFYGEEFLEIMESSIDKDNEYNWLKVITRNSNRTVHPIRHVLLINFLSSDIREFFKKDNNHYNPFGKSPWPCLNPVADHYRKDIVYNIKMTADYETRKPVGTFTCDCGFIYSRKGPDINCEDRYMMGRIKNFGHVWEKKLIRYLNLKDYSIRDIAKLMNCDPKTVVKYDKILGIDRFKDSKMNRVKENFKPDDAHNIDIEIYKNTILDFIFNNPNLSRTSIRELCKKEYSYIYKYDREWLLENLPKKLNKIQIDNKSNERVDWSKRDIEVLNAVKNEYLELLAKEKPIRITMSNLGKSLGLLSMLEKNLDKLPKSKAYLEEILESVEVFQLRRTKIIVDEKLENEEQVKLWEIQKKSGIRTEYFNNISVKIENYIDGRYKH
ncbi:TnsD family Tn7-like transposition protein [Alkaliphilus hydrothermalis]|uniref:Tn7-like transposition protein D n=1 Tax=Alkaliphilus hydrothermalis TaxID=1482730 RepID=A0ABS2NT89_9FIRM|nr:TnsD family Tn7-like transposition protein [Alkaliphilus hydrothermalis]MBM7616165.1 hypothetical protein [Alkaliphilus hydrothermalis]